MPSRLRTNGGTKISFFAFQDIITSVTGILILVTLIMALYINDDAPTARTTKDTETVQRQIADTQAKNEEMRQTLDAVAATPEPEALQAKIDERKRQLAKLAARQEKEAREQPAVPDLGGADLERLIRLNTDRREQMRLAAEAAEARSRELQSQMKDQVVLIPERDNSGKRPIITIVSGTKMTLERPGDTTRVTLTGNGLETQFANALKSFNAAAEYVVFYVRPSGIELALLCRPLAEQAGFSLGTDVIEENKEVIVGRGR